KNEVNCLVVPYKDADAIAKAVGAVFDKRIDVDAMVEEGFKVAEKGYDYRKKYDALDKLYTESMLELQGKM
ncbi:MAG: glycosyltransferase, partial [Bacteroidota bacterium]